MNVNLKAATAEQLAALLSFESMNVLWTRADEELMWQQLIATAIVPEFERFGVGSQAISEACSQANPRIHSFGDLLTHVAPPEIVLDAVRRLAKSQVSEAGDTGFAPIARALYYATLASAQVAGMRITKLGEGGLVNGLVWMRDQIWLDACTRQLVDRALKIVS